ncbi:hypothetical protein E2P61_04280 [Candidatus Bathyarchaeota archaeon]|nr:hypothetical protein E2P61_04280 [Candidatus Bathyarchaeota archaeon]
MKATKTNRGQFIIIAVLLAAIMIVSIGAIMHNAVTYYRSEPWEEYTTLVSNIELNSQRLVGLSPENEFETNFIKWQSDLTRLYPSEGIQLSYSYDYYLNGVTFTLNITSIGLEGYKFTAKP